MSLFRKIASALSGSNPAHQENQPATPWPDCNRGWDNAFPPGATAQDIYFCFRLMLGRNPNREEWPGHSARAGEPLTNIIQTYLHSQEFHNRKLMQRKIPSHIKEAACDGFKIFLAEDDIAVGRHVMAGTYEPEVTQVFERLLKPGMGVLDIGANIGYYSLMSAALVGDNGWVTAVEPNSENAKLIAASRSANNFKQLNIIQAAASDTNDIMVLRNEYSNGTCDALPKENTEVFAAETVACLKLAHVIHKKTDLIKVDVEGGEYLALKGCLDIIDRDRPSVIFEFSPPRIVDADGQNAWKALLVIFFERGYSLSVILADGGSAPCPSPEDAHKAFEESGVDHIDLLAQIPG